jgi:enamine deaminase RidA (YjgF/YER057c/UK114 family)
VISVSLARELRDAGLRWTPTAGDRFMLPNRDMDDDVFVLSDMTVELHEFPTGSVIGFNGVTEWALDSIEQEEAVWLPAEDQLRALLGGLFTRLEAAGDGFEVTVTLAGGTESYRAGDPSDAYGRALFEVLKAVTGSGIE